MDDITTVKNTCKCMSCNYLLCAIKKNEDAAGNYDLEIHCQLVRCPIDGAIETGLRQAAEKEAYIRINSCVDMLRRCIELKTKNVKEKSGNRSNRNRTIRRAAFER